MKINIFKEIQRLLQYGLKKELIKESDLIYTRNLILGALRLDEFKEEEILDEGLDSPVPILDKITDWAFNNGIVESKGSVYRDLFDTEIMNCLMPRPSEVIRNFYMFYERSPKRATDYFHDLSRNSNYIRTDRINRNIVWKAETEYGYMDITINLSKPEKEPKAIAAAKNMISSYPKCLLCRENEGYAGRLNHPARQNHRLIPVELNGEKWYLQYSPYGYYNEHCIVLKDIHEPMKISMDTFKELIEFVEKFPHYFIGSNADLPIVGGSILSHNHFQGGNYEFAMERAEMEHNFKLKNFKDVEAGIIKWPISVIRLKGKDPAEIIKLSNYILEKWRNYSDESVDILSHTNTVSHNTITPIARRRGELFEMDLALRNNRTSDEHPDGIFHPHRELHHIKKENIGLIEVMGLAVLPARLQSELEGIAYYLVNQDKETGLKNETDLVKHIPWYFELKAKYSRITKENVDEILKMETGGKFAAVLENAGVFKHSNEGREAFKKFIDCLNN